MTEQEARALLDDLEKEILERLPEGAGVALLVFNTDTGDTHYTSNLPRHMMLGLLKQFITRNTH